MSTTDNLVRVCDVNDLPAEGEMRDFPVGGGVLCVAKRNGKLFALDNECPHRGAPLAQGKLIGDKIMCPWHAYTFDIATGFCPDDSSIVAHGFALTMSGKDVLVNLEAPTS